MENKMVPQQKRKKNNGGLVSSINAGSSISHNPSLEPPSHAALRQTVQILLR